jgi:hypothetical protein
VKLYDNGGVSARLYDKGDVNVRLWQGNC